MGSGRRQVRIESIGSAATEERVWSFGAPFDVVVGRRVDAQVRVMQSGVSRTHCRIIGTNEQVRVVDCHSHNGTLLYERPVAVARLHDGDCIQVGAATLRISSTWTDDDVPPPDSDAGSLVDDESSPMFLVDDFVICDRCGESLSTFQMSAATVTILEDHFLCAKCMHLIRTEAPTFCGYRPFESLGRGASADVHKSLDEKRLRLVALKVVPVPPDLPVAAKKRLAREIDILRTLDHPGIVRLLDWGIEDFNLCMALEFVDGADLDSRIDSTGQPLEPRHAAEVARQVAVALDKTHRDGFVHRDVKPGNLLQSGGGAVKLTDFGLAKSFETCGISKVTKLGSVLGTPYYAAPEQLKDARLVGPSVDIYSLGATLYHLASGKAPFLGRVKSVNDVFKLKDYPPLPIEKINPRVPASLAAIIEKAMAVRPEDRHRHARELADELAGFLAKSDA